MVVWVVETAYDQVFPADKSKQVKKKSAIGGTKKSSSKKVEKEPESSNKSDADKKKVKRDKIEWHVFVMREIYNYLLVK